MLLQYQMIDDAADAPRKTNVILAAFTTAHARIILYKNMQMVNNARNVLYCDTDSIMYIHDKNQSEAVDIPIGTGLGEMTSELPVDLLTDTFWSAVPKLYCMLGHRRTNGLEYNVFKVKGITLNRAIEKTFNPETFKNCCWKKHMSCVVLSGLYAAMCELAKSRRGFEKRKQKSDR